MKKNKIEKVVIVREKRKDYHSVVVSQQNPRRRIACVMDAQRTREVVNGLEGVRKELPSSSELLLAIAQALGASFERIVIADSQMKEPTYVSTLVVRQGKQTFELDCRPSEALAIAAREQIPITVTPDAWTKHNWDFSNAAPHSVIWPYRSSEQL